MTDKESAFEQQARQNLSLSDKRMDAFLKKASALRRNLKLRKKQQTERQKQCTHSK